MTTFTRIRSCEHNATALVCGRHHLTGGVKALTRAERRLQAEVRDIALLIDVDFWAVEENYKPGYRKAKLELMKDKLIRSEIIYRYTLIDEF